MNSKLSSIIYYVHRSHSDDKWPFLKVVSLHVNTDQEIVADKVVSERFSHVALLAMWVSNASLASLLHLAEGGLKV